MPNLFSEDRLLLAARLYYVDRLDQGEVAKFIRVSQPMVSRLLARARERGLVRISVADYDPRHRDLEEKIRRRYGLHTVVVIKSFDAKPDADLRRSLGHFASMAFDTIIFPGDTVAVAGGRTIYELVRRLPEARYQNLSVIQGMGSVRSPASAYDAHSIGELMAKRLGGAFTGLDHPAYLADGQRRKAYADGLDVRQVEEKLSRTRLALVGVGTLENSIFVESGALAEKDILLLRKAGAVAEIFGRFFDVHGAECETPWREQVMSLSAAKLRAIPLVIAVVSGVDRVEAVVAAIRGSLIRGLVIDEAAASALLARGEQEGVGRSGLTPHRRVATPRQREVLSAADPRSS